MAKQVLLIGASPNDGSGDPLRTAAQKINANFTELYEGAASPRRELLTENRAYYVATTGSDTNNGLSAGAPFLTITKALSVAAGLDCGGFLVSIMLADGTYSLSATLELPPTTFCGKLTIQGNPTTPANVEINSASAIGTVIRANQATCEYVLSGFRIASSHGAGLIVARYGGKITVVGIEFGATTGTHLAAQMRGFVTISGGYSIVGSGFVHLSADIGSVIEFGSFTVTAVGSPAFTIFAYAASTSIFYTGSVVYSGTVTGKRYYAEAGGLLNTNGGGANYFPGNSAGSVATGAQYL